jgi:protease IV
LQLRQVTRAIKASAKDSRIVGVFIHGHLSPSGYGTGLAAIREVREALEEVKAAGKPIVAYLDSPMTRDMYLASVADEIVLDPFGEVFLPGLATEPMFYAGAFEKYGVRVNPTRHGKYKSYVEAFTRRDMSPENREQTQTLLNDIWGTIVSDISEARHITPAELQALVDSEGLIRPESALKHHLVTRIGYRDQIIDDLKARTGRKGSHQSFKQVAMSDYAAQVHETPLAFSHTGAKAASHDGKIAVVYAEGAIVDGKGQLDEIGSDRFSKEIRKFRLDNDVKALVLRVNSPGGSSSASEEIQREIRLTLKVKPVVISMGSYAASGGYWISAYGTRIFAEPSTITGSIGVFGLSFDVEKLANDFGLTFDRVKTGKFADAMTITRAKTPEELAIIQNMVDWIYDQFVKKVAEGRKIDPAKVEEIAQGRVWSGTAALKLGLVDEIGGLDTAIKYAAKEAQLGPQYQLVEYPKKMELAEVIAEAIGAAREGNTQSGLVTRMTKQVKEQLHTLDQFNSPNSVYARMPLELKLP